MGYHCILKQIRTLILGLAFFVGSTSQIPAQVRSSALKDLPKLSPTEATQLLDKVRAARVKGDYCLHVSLSHIPRKGPKSSTYAVIWGTWTSLGPCMRIEMGPEAKRTPQNTTQLLLQNGSNPQAWIVRPASTLETLEGPALYAPIMPPLQISAFELQMGFLYWPQVQYIGPESLKGRCAQCFELRPQESSSAPYSKARIAVDSSFYCLLKAELFDNEGKVARTLKILDFKKARGQWMVQSLDDVNMHSRSKTRLQVMAAALELDLPKSLFTPAALTSPLPALPPEQFVLF